VECRKRRRADRDNNRAVVVVPVVVAAAVVRAAVLVVVVLGLVDLLVLAAVVLVHFEVDSESAVDHREVEEASAEHRGVVETLVHESYHDRNRPLTQPDEHQIGSTEAVERRHDRLVVENQVEIAAVMDNQGIHLMVVGVGRHREPYLDLFRWTLLFIYENEERRDEYK